MAWHEYPLVFDCSGERLIGIVTQPMQPVDIGVVIVVGGPQYRSGSHRQFTLLARLLAEQDIASLRFDYRGMGDSEGDMRNFEAIDVDIHAAIDALIKQMPQLRAISLWGLCDAASAAMLYAGGDPRVAGLILLNPWVFTVEGAAKTRLKHYYWNRLFDASFWKKAVSGNLNLLATLRDLAGSLSQASQGTGKHVGGHSDGDWPPDPATPLPERMLAGLSRFPGPVLLILSGNDLTAKEFLSVTSSNSAWTRRLSARDVTRHDLVEATHTFSTREWRDQVAEWTTKWVKQLAGTPRADAPKTLIGEPGAWEH
jgi:exosortase A-associated hydrolase 1